MEEKISTICSDQVIFGREKGQFETKLKTEGHGATTLKYITLRTVKRSEKIRNKL